MFSNTNKDFENEIETPIDPNRLYLEGVPDNCQDELIRLYIVLILNPTLDESFKIEEMRRNKRRVLIKFNKKLTFDEIISRQKKVPNLCGSSVIFAESRIPNTIRLTNLANTTTKEILNLYFSNAKISNGGDIKSIKMFNFENKALLQFCDYRKVEEVLNHSHVICEQLIKLEKYYGAIEEEYLREEEEIETQLNDETILNQMRDPKGKKKSMFSIKSFAPPATIDKTKIVIANIQENVNIQQLDFLIQLITNKADIKEINWSLEYKGKLLIDFQKETDVSNILLEFNNNHFNNLNGKPVHLETVNVTNTLVVLVKDSKERRSKFKIDSKNEDEEYKPESIPATKDLLDLYFHNRQRSGGGEVESIERKSSRCWLIIMKDQRSIKEILSKKHSVDEKPIKIFPYYENFGLPYLFKPIFDDQKDSNSAYVFKLKIKDERLRYFGKVKSLQKKLNEILSESNAVSRYNKQESNIIYVSYIEKLKSKVPYNEKMWRLRVKESIEYFLQVYKYEKLTLSFNQWATISKTKQLNEVFLGNQLSIDEDLDDSVSTSSEYKKIKYLSNNLAIIDINETSTNIEISIVGPNSDVDKFIVKIKDIICKAYFTFELEEKIIKFKTYLFECEELLSKWLSEGSNEADSDTEIVLASGRSNESDTSSINFTKKSETKFKLNKSRRHTIDEFLSKLERDHLDMELSYGKLFQELGYTFLTQASEDPTDEDDEDYKDFSDRVSSALDEASVVMNPEADSESQMDKIKYTLDDLRSRINLMRKSFRQYIIKAKRHARNNKTSEISEEGDYDFDDDEEDNEELFKLCVYVKDKSKILTFRIHRKCKVKELKQILFEKIADPKENTIDDMILTFNESELDNDSYTIGDYNIGDKCTITLEFDERPH